MIFDSFNFLFRNLCSYRTQDQKDEKNDAKEVLIFFLKKKASSIIFYILRSNKIHFRKFFWVMGPHTYVRMNV